MAQPGEFANQAFRNNSKLFEDVLLMNFVSPISFTGEDAFEINCHGMLIIVI